MSAEAIVVTVRDAAAMLSISRSRVYELLTEGALASVRIGRSRRITVRSIRRLLADAALVPRISKEPKEPKEIVAANNPTAPPTRPPKPAPNKPAPFRPTPGKHPFAAGSAVAEAHIAARGRSSTAR